MAAFEEKWFLSQIKRNKETGNYDKGVVVHSSKKMLSTDFMLISELMAMVKMAQLTMYNAQ